MLAVAIQGIFAGLLAVTFFIAILKALGLFESVDEDDFESVDEDDDEF